MIALGNGTACRETESWLSDLLQKNTFAPLDVTYTIVNESGASIYSCSEEAKKEFSTLDPNLISAGRLILAELLKLKIVLNSFPCTESSRTTGRVGKSGTKTLGRWYVPTRSTEKAIGASTG